MGQPTPPAADATPQPPTPSTPSSTPPAPQDWMAQRQAAINASMSGAETPPKPAGPKKVVSPYYFKYLNDQAAAITAKGGTDADVKQFLDLEQGKPFSGAAPGSPQYNNKTPTLQDLLGPDAHPSAVRGVSMAVLQGATFGFGDEAVGSILGLATGVGARAGIDEYRREYSEWAQDHGKTAIAAEIGGGLLPAVLTAGASMEGALTKQGIGATMKVAGAYGAAYGAGNAEGDVSDRMWGAVTGAVVGAATGGTGAALGHFVVAPTVAKLAATSLGKPIAAAVEQTLAKIAGRDVIALTPEAQARQRLAAAYIADGSDFNAVKGSLADMHRAEVPATLIDAGGDNVQALAADALSTRSPATSAVIEGLKERLGDQQQRLTSGLLEAAIQRPRLGIANATETAEQLQAKALIDSKPLYETAHEQVVQMTPALQQLFKAPEIRAGWDAGASMAQGEDLAGIGHGLPVPQLKDVTGTPNAMSADAIRKANPNISDDMLGKILGKQGMAASSDLQLPVRGIDYLQRGLQEIINKGRNAEGWSAQRIRTIQALRDQVVSEAEQQSPAFAAARAAYRGPTASNDAIDAGKAMFNKSPAELASAMNDLHPDDRDYARLGYTQKVYDETLKDNTGDVARTFFGGNMIGKPSYRMEQIKALFPEAPAAAEAFARRLAGETAISHATGNVVRGLAPTSLQKLEQGAVLPPARINATGLGLSVARQGLQALRGAMSRDQADELTHLFSRGLTRVSPADNGAIPAKLQVTLDNLHHSFAGIVPKANARIAAGRAAGQIAAHVVGR